MRRVNRRTRILCAICFFFLLYVVAYKAISSENKSLTDPNSVAKVTFGNDLQTFISGVPHVPSVEFKKRTRSFPCPNLKQPWQVKDHQIWQEVADRGNNAASLGDPGVKLFSAHFDDQSKGTDNSKRNVIKIIALYASYANKLLCQVWYTSRRELEVLPARLVEIPEGYNKKYKFGLLVCRLTTIDVPYAVSLVRRKCNEPTNILSVQRPTSVASKFTVCVTPLNLRFNDVHQFVEMLEVNRLFGADKFVFYNYSAGREMNTLLSRLQSESLAQVVQWSLPLESDASSRRAVPVDVHYFGQLAALNDCLYRHRSSEMIVFTDLDELIVPRKHSSWRDMLNEVDVGDTNRHGVYMFRCSFFRRDWPDTDLEFPEKLFAVNYKLSTLLKVNREPYILPPSTRSKFMVRPKAVEAVGIHNVWEYVRGSREIVVDPPIGLLHHYRDWENPGDKNRQLDTNIHRFKSEIVNRVSLRWTKMLRGEQKM